MVTNPLINRVMKVKNKAKVFHSSGYARAQSGENFGAATGESFAARRAVEERRRFVRGYNNAKIMHGAYALERARSYVPRTGGAKAAGGLGTAGGRGEAVGRGTTGGLGVAGGRGAAEKMGTEKMGVPPARKVCYNKGGRGGFSSVG